MLIREAEPSDAQSILTITQLVRADTYANEELGISYDEVYANYPVTSASIQSMQDELSLASTAGWVVESEDSTQGFCLVRKSEQGGEIGSLLVKKEYQGQGIGSDFHRRAMKWFGDTRPIRLDAVTYNDRVISWYQRLGFVINGPSLNDSQVLASGIRIPVFEMVLE